MADETLYAFVDYENVRKAFPNYVEYVKLTDVIQAFEELGSELGTLRGMTFFGDWTRRPIDAHEVENRGYRADNVLSTRYSRGKDRSDTRMSFAMDDMARERSDITSFIVGAGDADYKEAILRVRERGRRVYILSFGITISREYFTMTHGVFPLETRLGLTPKSPIQPTLPGPIGSPPDLRALAINRIDSLEKTLESVIRNYLVNKILLPAHTYGETPREVHQFIDSLVTDGILEEEEIDNPAVPGRTVKRVKLKRDHPVVIDALTRK